MAKRTDRPRPHSRTGPRPPCQTCGLPHVRKDGQWSCTAHLQRDRKGEPCGMMPCAGVDVCARHGGQKALDSQRAAKRSAAKVVAKAVATLGAPIDETLLDPGLQLLELIRWSAVHVQWLRERVQALDEDALVWGRTREEAKQATEFRGTDTTREARPHAYLVLYGEWSDRHANYCALALRAGIQERQVRLAEQQGRLAGEAIRQILDGMLERVLADLTEQDERPAFMAAWQRWVTEVVPPILRSMRGGIPEPKAVTS